MPASDRTPLPRPPLVIVNPRASRLHDPGRRARIRSSLLAALEARGARDPDWVDGSHEAAIEALRDIADRPLVVAVGGDGTVREVASAVTGTGVPLAIVPGGTGNVLAGALRIGGAGAAMTAIQRGVVRRLDLGHARWGTADGDIHERLFSVACGTGFDARIMSAADHGWKRRLAFGAYVGAALSEARHLHPSRFRIRADDDELEVDALVALVANCGDLVPGRLGAREPIDPTDGRLDLLVVGGRSVLAGVRGAAELLLRSGSLDGRVVRRPVRRVRIETDPPQPTQTDGDAHAPGWLEAVVLPGALDVLVGPSR